MSFSQFVQAFAIAAVAALGATSAQAASSAASHMTLGATALPPQAYIELCAHQPLACGSDAAEVLAGAAQAEAEYRALLGGAATAPAPIRAETEAPEADPALTPALQEAMTEVNARVNRAIRPVKDSAARDTWSLPLADRRRAGDCEDYVLEKLQALLSRGVPRSALNIATAVTPWGENHAVLVVATADGDFVLDNLDPQVRRWDDVPYRWTKRQVAGRAFEWAMIRNAPKTSAALGD